MEQRKTRWTRKSQPPCPERTQVRFANRGRNAYGRSPTGMTMLFLAIERIHTCILAAESFLPCLSPRRLSRISLVEHAGLRRGMATTPDALSSASLGRVEGQCHFQAKDTRLTCAWQAGSSSRHVGSQLMHKNAVGGCL